MIRAALRMNHLCDRVSRLADVHKSTRFRESSLLVFFRWCCLAAASFTYSAIFRLSPPPTDPFLPAMMFCFCRMATPFRIRILMNLDVGFFIGFSCEVYFSVSFLFFVCMIQAPPPPTSCPCSPVGCRAISLLVSPAPLPPQRRSLSAHAHGERAPHVLSLFFFLSHSLSLLHAHTHARHLAAF